MASYSHPNSQAQALLQTLCKFMLPLIRIALGQSVDMKNICFGIEADEFVIELKKFISAMISRSQPRLQDIAIEAKLDEVSHSEGHIPTNQSSPVSRLRASKLLTPRAVPLDDNEKDLGESLQILRKHVTQKMPIRLLCFEPHNSKLRITLLERAEIYDHLVLRSRAALNVPSGLSIPWWKPAQYAILSHTWTQTPGELTFGDWKTGPLDEMQPKCRKLVNFCKAAWEKHGLTLGWIDTVCINKESSAELDESIRSMYAWYENAEVCITYLAGTKTVLDMRNDPWFTRGWTLQELVAPSCVKFYNKDWKELSWISDDKWDLNIQTEITHATTITSDELQNIRRTSISRRMQLAAKRQVTRGEDIAYCLMGIFDVSISTAYGEGADRAFFRLVEEIFRSFTDVSDIFNWAGGFDRDTRLPISSLFPFRPSDYLSRSETKQLQPWHPIEPLILTHLGLRIPILLMPAVPLCESISPDPRPIGDYHATVFVVPSEKYHTPLRSNLPEHYHLLDKRASGTEGMHKVVPYLRSTMEMITLTFGTLNVEKQGTNIHIPKTCLAVLLKQQVKPFSPSYKKIHTKAPIVFDLKKTGNDPDVVADDDYYHIERSQLATMGCN